MAALAYQRERLHISKSTKIDHEKNVDRITTEIMNECYVAIYESVFFFISSHQQRDYFIQYPPCVISLLNIYFAHIPHSLNIHLHSEPTGKPEDCIYLPIIYYETADKDLLSPVGSNGFTPTFKYLMSLRIHLFSCLSNAAVIMDGVLSLHNSI